MPIEVPTFNMAPERRDLTGHEIEQAINLAPQSPEATIDIYEDVVATPPEFFMVPQTNPEVVPIVTPAHIEAQPSLIDQNETMSPPQAAAYVRTLTDTLVHIAREDKLRAA